VPVSEASVNIVAVGAHRKGALDATEYLINTLKERVPIWKKEFYTEEEAA
jgi:molybdopterin synthase catalytic subunit